MSRTAGVGMADYTAVNPFAVGAMVLGLASALTTIFREPFLLGLPLLGLLLGVLALVQVKNSNGTQAGKLLALGGIILSLAFGGLVVVNHFKEKARLERYKQSLTKLVSDWGDDLVAGNFDQMYAKFDAPFQNRVKMDVFKARLSQVRDGRLYMAKPTAIHLEPRIAIELDESTGQHTALGVMKLEVEKPPGTDADLMTFENIYFRQVEGEWKIEDIPTYFERPAPAAEHSHSH